MRKIAAACVSIYVLFILMGLIENHSHIKVSEIVRGLIRIGLGAYVVYGIWTAKKWGRSWGIFYTGILSGLGIISFLMLQYAQNNSSGINLPAFPFHIIIPLVVAFVILIFSKNEFEEIE